ncbi:bacteriocin [Staphylococcus aureus]
MEIHLITRLKINRKTWLKSLNKKELSKINGGI